MANTKRTKASKVSAEDSTVPAPQNVQVKVTEKKGERSTPIRDAHSNSCSLLIPLTSNGTKAYY